MGGVTSVETTPSGRPLGRPREFDGDSVVDAVVQLFWERGYAGTSIGDVVERTGLSKSSLYGAFGTKDALFRLALDRYLADHEAVVGTTLVSGTEGLADIDAFLDRVGEQAELESPVRGCFIVNTSTEMGGTEPAVVDCGLRHRAFLQQGFEAALSRAAASGEFMADRIESTASVLVTTMIGLAVMMSGGATVDEIRVHIAAAKLLLRSQ